MLISGALYKKMEADLCLNMTFVKGQDLNVRNCWHFSSDGESVEMLFYDRLDFVGGMNRIYVLSRQFNVVILAFVLMDTHVHFVLYGDFDECNHFVHEYFRRTSQSIEQRHKKAKALLGIRVDHQLVDTDRYLKGVISYTCRNPVVAGLPYTYYDYPWSSAPLYFRSTGVWTSPAFLYASPSVVGVNSMKQILKSKQVESERLVILDDLVYPGEYVAVEVVERIFRSRKAFFFFMEHTREDEIESRGGSISRLSIPIQEMRINRAEMSKQLFGTSNLRCLDTRQRVMLARAVKAKYNSSVKQIARVCGLVIAEAEKIL